jgi:hypothetical protein
VNSDIEACIRSAPEDVSRISEQLAIVGQLLADGNLVRNDRDSTKAELQAYRGNLERLRTTLAAMEGRLRARRDLLLLQRQHLSAVGEWALNTKELK